MLDTEAANPACTTNSLCPNSRLGVARRAGAAAPARRRGAERHLARYIAGWAVADPARIAAAAAADYRFEDPLVGVFDRHSLEDYLTLLRQRVGFGTPGVRGCKVSFERYPALLPPDGPIRFWRSLPETGLAGTSEIELDASGVRREIVCYEMSLATEQLRGL